MHNLQKNPRLLEKQEFLKTPKSLRYRQIDCKNSASKIQNRCLGYITNVTDTSQLVLF